MSSQDLVATAASKSVAAQGVKVWHRPQPTDLEMFSGPVFTYPMNTTTAHLIDFYARQLDAAATQFNAWWTTGAVLDDAAAERVLIVLTQLVDGIAEVHQMRRWWNTLPVSRDVFARLTAALEVFQVVIGGRSVGRVGMTRPVADLIAEVRRLAER